MEELFAAETEGEERQPPSGDQAWRILVVDDDPEVHVVTRMALRGMRFDGLPVEIISVYSAAEARAFFQANQRNRIAMILLDVVMETEHAGLEFAKYLRNELKNKIVRICLRTGQPGSAPERTVIVEYDINDYKAKTDLSSQRLFTTVYAALRSYRDLVVIERSRRGLEHILAATPEIFGTKSLLKFASGALDQLMGLIRCEQDAVYVNSRAVAILRREVAYEVLAGIGAYSEHVGRAADEALPSQVFDRLRKVEGSNSVLAGDGWLAVNALCGNENAMLHLDVERKMDSIDVQLVEVFTRQLGLAFQNIRLNEAVLDTQKKLVFMLSEAIEARSRETGNHVRRVAKSARVLAALLGLSDDEQTIVEAAAPLHDVGKIAVPDAILQKPGKLDPHEWDIMKTHAQAGADILKHSSGPIFEAGAIIASQHHEKWNGSGYPLGIGGSEIHLYGRIGAITDVFDALASDRCYKKAWPISKVVEYLNAEAGKHFDPTLADIFLKNLDLFTAIQSEFPDKSFA